MRYSVVTGEGMMMAQTSMLHVRVDDKLKADAAEKLANFGLTVSDAVRVLLTRVAKEGGLPAGLTTDADAYDAWFRSKVQEALEDTRPAVPISRSWPMCKRSSTRSAVPILEWREPARAETCYRLSTTSRTTTQTPRNA